MGNQLSQPQKLQPEHLAEVPKVVLKENLGASLPFFLIHDTWPVLASPSGLSSSY